VADSAKIGTDWTDDELDAIVADYFAMLAAEQAGQAYVKAHHSARLMGEIGRTHRSVEFKHMNISAVLEELGRPTIRGYKPKANYQRSILQAIERRLLQPESLWTPALLAEVAEPPALFLEPPPPLRTPKPRPEYMERLVRKFDAGERDFRNRELGRAGEGPCTSSSSGACVMRSVPISRARCAGWRRRTAMAPATTSTPSTGKAGIG
jgi:hypothetical protein